MSVGTRAKLSAMEKKLAPEVEPISICLQIVDGNMTDGTGKVTDYYCMNEPARNERLKKSLDAGNISSGEYLRLIHEPFKPEWSKTPY